MVAELDPKLLALSTSEKLILIDLLWGAFQRMTFQCLSFIVI